MPRFHIVHVLSDNFPGFEAYQEVIETVGWGLQQLGHEVTNGVNGISSNATNIIFGANRAENFISLAPDDTICYNLEQLRGHRQFTPRHEPSMADYIARKFRIWDYSSANIPRWNSLNPTYPVKHMPIGYAPLLSRIHKEDTQDIDVLIYGSASDRRLSVFSSLTKAHISSVFAYRLYGSNRDSLIARSKIVLNIGNADGQIFEIVRVSFLMANSKAVVSDFSSGSHIEHDIVDGLVFAHTEGVVQACNLLLADKERRVETERQALESISRRDICGFLSAALA